MNALRWTVPAVSVALVGCASPPFAGTWYLVEDKVTVAVLNQTGATCTVTRLELNRPDRPDSGSSEPSGMELPNSRRMPKRGKLYPEHPWELPPGGLIVVSLGEDELKTCTLPVEIIVHTETSACSGKTLRTDWFLKDAYDTPTIRLTAGLPNALPYGWEDCPHPKK